MKDISSLVKNIIRWAVAYYILGILFLVFVASVLWFDNVFNTPAPVKVAVVIISIFILAKITTEILSRVLSVLQRIQGKANKKSTPS